MPKTIFGTTEKSNFILNMKYDTVRKWLSGLLYASMILVTLGGAFITFTAEPNWALGSFLYAAGFSCVLFYIVLLMRKDIRFKDIPAVYLIIALAVLAFASYYSVVLSGRSQTYVNTAMLGEMGRYEGLLAIFAYFGIFLLAASVMKFSTVKTIFDIFIGAGIFQALIAVMQHIPWGFPSDFRKLPALVFLKDVHLSSGLSDSPIFYGSFLTLAVAAAIVGALYDKNVLRARIYGFAAALLFLTGLFTSSVVPLIGMGTALLITVIVEFTAGKGGTKFESGLLKSSRKRLLALILSFGAIFALVFAFQGINLKDTNPNGSVYRRDKTIAYTDAYNRLFIVGSPAPATTDSHWKTGRERSITMIKDHPILGVGPDIMARAQLSNKELINDSIDRSYNEYLYIAATRGIPSLIVYIALLFATLARLFKGMKEFAADREKWFRPALLTAVLAYSVQAFFSASAVTVAPFFWLMLGIAWSNFTDEAKKNPAKK